VAHDITVTIIAKNSSATLRQCLQALSGFREVVLLDTGSTDDTMTIARSFPNVVLYEHSFAGFGPMKNLAISKASNEWILSIDSDEVVTPELASEIAGMKLDESCIYEVGRDNHYHGRLIEGCGWNRDRVQRLFNRKRVRFNDRLIHEGLAVPEGVTVTPLKGRLKHYPYNEAAQLLQKMQQYSTLWAEENLGKKRSTPVKAVLNGLVTFFKSYILQSGWRYGYEGLLISVSNANGAFYKYIKLYEASRNGTDL
jgi:glycosyltransferase involved in cell wall biosynthesis